MNTRTPGRVRRCLLSALTVLALGCALAPATAALARDILFVYGGYEDDNAYGRTLELAKREHAGDRVAETLDALDLEYRFSDLMVFDGDAEVITTCDGGAPPDLKLLEAELERLKRSLDFEGMVFAYNVALEELACAGTSFTRAEAASLYAERAMVHFKNGDEGLARADFRRAFVIDPSLPWNKRHTPKAKDDFERARMETADAYTVSLYVADDGPSGSGVFIDGVQLRPGTATRVVPGTHLIAWAGPDGGESGLIDIYDTTTFIGSRGLFDFLFREPVDQAEEALRYAVLEEMAWREEVGKVVLLDPVFARGSLARQGRFASPARAGFGGGYSRYSQFNYGAFHADLRIRIYQALHAELKAQFDMTSGKATGGTVTGEVEEEDEAPLRSDYYVMPTITLGLGGHLTHGQFQPGGGIGIRLDFTGPSLLLLPSLLFHGGLDMRPWDPPIVLRLDIQWGMIIASSSNTGDRPLSWSGGTRGIFGATLGVAFIL
jgi:hypothetical protein